MRRSPALFLFATLAACSVDKPATEQAPAAPASAAPASAPTPPSVRAKPPRPPRPPSVVETPVPPGALPAADRVFTVPQPAGKGDLVLGADGDQLWAADPTPKGGDVRWRMAGPGVVVAVASGDLGQGERIFTARGVGRGYLDAPLVLQSLEPKSGLPEELFRNQGERDEPVTLAVEDVDRDSKPELSFAYYASKYMVRTHHLKPGAQGRLEAMPEGPDIRMATSRTYADLDGDGKADEILGRVYGDAKDVPGDLRIDTGHGLVPVAADKGVKALLVARLAGDARPTLYFSDGWVADYGKQAHAGIARARPTKDGFTVERVAGSAGEFTFFQLDAIDVDGDGKPEVVARGDKRLTVFTPTEKGEWAGRAVTDLEPVLNVAYGRDAAGAWRAYLPSRAGVRAVPLK